MVSSASSIAASTSASVYNYQSAVREISLSTARLSSGSRIVRAGDDVAALASGTQLKTNIASLRQALSNTTQADSMLQVAYSSLSTIHDVLTEMKSVAVAATSGSLTTTERSFLQAQFESLQDQVDSIAQGSEFNNIKLLDGTLSEENRVRTNTTAATQASNDLVFTSNVTSGQTVIINGVTLTEGTNFTAGATTNLTLIDLADAINTTTNTNLSRVSATVSGNTLTLKDRAGGALGFRNYVDDASTATFSMSGATTAAATKNSFANGNNSGLTMGSVIAYGSVGDSLINTQSMNRGEVTYNLATQATDGNTFSIDNSNSGVTAFTFRTAPTLSTEIRIGSKVEETLQNLIDTLGKQTGNIRYTLDQLDIMRDGQNVYFRNKLNGNALDLVNTAINFAETSTGTLSATTMASGATNGINVDGVTNKDWLGTISGFSATYNAPDDITATLVVGDYTYRAEIDDTTPATATVARFLSTVDGGGYFDMQLAAGGQTVNNQADADTFANRLSAAMQGFTFSQVRTAQTSDYNASGDLIGSSFEFELRDFSKVDVESISITAPTSASGSAVIEFKVNGETFRSNSNLGQSISEYEIVEFSSTSSDNVLRLRMGNDQIDMTDANEAAAAENLFRSAFGIGTAQNGVSFQIGSNSANTLDVSIGSAMSEKLFGGASLNVSSVSGATTAQTSLDAALAEVQEMMTEVGAMQERAMYASEMLDAEISAKDEARASLLDTDVATESTRLAAFTVQAQGAIAVLAQAQQLSSNLLTLMQRSA